MIKAVLFDLDGTLVNSLDDLATSANSALETKGYPTHETEKYKYFVGHGMKNLMERVLPENHRSEAEILELLGIFLAHYSEHFADKTRPYDGIIPLLGALRQKNIKLGVVTNKADHMAQIIIKSLLGGYFDYILGKRDEFPAKPDPAATLYAMKQLDVLPNECIFIGDSGMDAKNGVNCGAVPVGALWGFREKAELLENGAQYTVNAPLELLDIIEDLNA